MPKKGIVLTGNLIRHIHEILPNNSHLNYLFEILLKNH